MAVSMIGASARLSTSVWKEHITDRKGVVIIRAGEVVNGPRKDHFIAHDMAKISILEFKRYVYLLELYAPSKACVT